MVVVALLVPVVGAWVGLEVVEFTVVAEEEDWGLV